MRETEKRRRKDCRERGTERKKEKRGRPKRKTKKASKARQGMEEVVGVRLFRWKETKRTVSMNVAVPMAASSSPSIVCLRWVEICSFSPFYTSHLANAPFSFLTLVFHSPYTLETQLPPSLSPKCLNHRLGLLSTIEHTSSRHQSEKRQQLSLSCLFPFALCC